MISSASSISATVGAPKVVPRVERLGHRLLDRRVAMAEDVRPVAADVVEVALAVLAPQPGAGGGAHEDRLAADAAEGAHRRVDPAGHHPLGARQQLLARRACVSLAPRAHSLHPLARSRAASRAP